ncbi:carbohydrate ABC transporter permease [Rathayibacter sp. VKM Ac-2927]|uniref:carbohydrate ABC transporter permease n=1 Tax=Rathayibacter sp. VKM Ac-2927 TaxID=2929478 RepID=UPI001FB3583E|nr:sugar ABC transporter permease [Rathayibacter sp. VKM Ac-2927]MCJ1688247.1 sugar ABC transporter permease [Rathayibacter sp. VKM Ac-2927]
MTTATETGRLLRREAEPGVAAVAAPAPRRRRPGGQLAAWAFLAPLVVYLLVFYAFPLYRNLELSLKDYTVRSFVQGNAPFVWFDNYVQVFRDPTFGPALLHTAVFTGVSLIFQFTLGLALAVFFYRRFPLASTLRALFLVPWLLPLIVSASTWSWMLNSDSGIVNAFLESFGIGQINWLTSPSTSLIAVLIANIWIGIPFNLVILYSGLQNIPQDLYEAASLDGATGAQQFWRITLPLLRPVSAITILLGLVYTLKVFDIIWIMTKGGPADSSTTLATWTYQLGFGSMLPDFGPAAAVGNLLIILALVFGLIYIRVQRKQADA